MEINLPQYWDGFVMGIIVSVAIVFGFCFIRAFNRNVINSNGDKTAIKPSKIINKDDK